MCIVCVCVVCVFTRVCHGVNVTYLMVGVRWLGEIEIAREPGSECALGCTRRLSISISIVGLNCEDICRHGAGVGRIE